MAVAERPTPSGATGRRDLIESIIGSTLDPPNLSGRKNRLDSGYLIEHPDDTVAIGMQLRNAGRVQLGSEPEPSRFDALHARLLDSPDGQQLTAPDGVAQRFIAWPVDILISRGQVVV